MKRDETYERFRSAYESNQFTMPKQAAPNTDAPAADAPEQAAGNQFTNVKQDAPAAKSPNSDREKKDFLSVLGFVLGVLAFLSALVLLVFTVLILPPDLVKDYSIWSDSRRSGSEYIGLAYVLMLFFIYIPIMLSALPLALASLTVSIFGIVRGRRNRSLSIAGCVLGAFALAGTVVSIMVFKFI